MMKNIDYIIVGGGFAGLFFAHQLIKSNKSFVLYSDNSKSASKVSAGIVNPVVLKKFTTFWLAEEQINFLSKTLFEMENYLGENFIMNENIHRLFHDEREKELWLKKSQTEILSQFLDSNFLELDNVNNLFSAGRVRHSFRLNISRFFECFKSFLTINSNLIEEPFIYESLDTVNSTYKDYRYSNIVFCEGIGVFNNPFFRNIPISPNKGHRIEIKLSSNLKNVIYKKKHFLFRLTNDFYYYGGTYDRNSTSDHIDKSSLEQLINGLNEFYPQDYKILNCDFAFRPTVKDRRPILGSHNEYSNMYVFNGLGARGILNASYFSNHLYEHIENQLLLHPEVDLNRFSV